MDGAGLWLWRTQSHHRRCPRQPSARVREVPSEPPVPAAPQKLPRACWKLLHLPELQRPTASLSGQTGRVTPEEQAAAWAAKAPPDQEAGSPLPLAQPCPVEWPRPARCWLKTIFPPRHPISQVLSTGSSSATDKHAQVSFALKNKTLSLTPHPLRLRPQLPPIYSKVPLERAHTHRVSSPLSTPRAPAAWFPRPSRH